jgi:hypothetical protein
MAVYGNRLAGVTSDGGFVVWELPDLITDDVPYVLSGYIARMAFLTYLYVSHSVARFCFASYPPKAKKRFIL